MPESLVYLSVLNLDGTARTVRDRYAVSFNESQDLTSEQQAIARANIGAGSASYPTLTDTDIETGTDTAPSTVRADYLKTAINSLIDTKIDAAITQALAASY